MRFTTGLFCLLLALGLSASQDWDDSHLAVPRSDSHPIDTVVFLAAWGVEAANEQIARWEVDGEMRSRLEARAAYRAFRDSRLRADQGPASAPQPRAPGSVPAPTLESAPEPVSGQAPTPIPAPASAADDSAPSNADLLLRIERLEASYSALQSQSHSMIWDIDLLKRAKDELAERLNDLSQKYSELLASHTDLQDRHSALLSKHDALERAYAEIVHILETGEGADRVSGGNVFIQPTPIERRPESAEAQDLNKKGLDALDADRAPEAVRWFLQAAREGSLNAANSLGFLYEHGWGTVQSYQEAYSWYMRAAESGQEHAMRNVARFYEEGKGVLPNEDRSLFWRTQATMAAQE